MNNPFSSDNPARGRTLITFPAPPAFWEIVDSWADMQGMRCVRSSDEAREYVRREWVANLRIHARLSAAGSDACVEGWTSVSRWSLLVPYHLSVLIPWARLDYNLAYQPADLGRLTVNFLLSRLGQPRIPEPEEAVKSP